MRVLPLVAAALVAVAPSLAPAADPARGRDLYESACIGCHGRSVHARARTSVQGCAALRATVARFAGVQGLRWDAEDVDDVVAWLSLRYYGFPLQEGRCVAPVAAQPVVRASAR
jgi:mono/diheme cytochrome c family protein